LEGVREHFQEVLRLFGVLLLLLLSFPQNVGMIQQFLKALVLRLSLAGTQCLTVHFQEAVNLAVLGLTHGGKLLLAAFLVQFVEAPGD
jgi:hypothetical protein